MISILHKETQKKGNKRKTEKKEMKERQRKGNKRDRERRNNRDREIGN